MLPKQDIWRSAAAKIKRYSTEAGLEATTRADELLAVSDVEAGATWRRLMPVIEQLQAGKPEGTRVN